VQEPRHSKAQTVFHDNNTKGKNMDKYCDCTIVDRSVRLRNLKHWKMNCKGPVPFYLLMEDGSGIVFDDKPDIVRQLMRVYNSQKLFFNVELITFLKAEGIDARRVSALVEDVLGYRAELSNN